MSENYRIRKIHGRLQRAGGSGVKDNPRKLLPLSLNIYRFRLMKSPFLQNLDELPGPVWLFGAYGMTRLGEWSFALLMQCVNGNLQMCIRDRPQGRRYGHPRMVGRETL